MEYFNVGDTISFVATELGTGNKLMRSITNRAKLSPKKVVFAEADHLNVLKAAQIVYEEGIAKPILLGNKVIISRLMKEILFDAKIPIIDPKSKAEEKYELKNNLVNKIN